jgi:hypothetical protein
MPLSAAELRDMSKAHQEDMDEQDWKWTTLSGQSIWGAGSWVVIEEDSDGGWGGSPGRGSPPRWGGSPSPKRRRFSGEFATPVATKEPARDSVAPPSASVDSPLAKEREDKFGKEAAGYLHTMENNCGKEAFKWPRRISERVLDETTLEFIMRLAVAGHVFGNGGRGALRALKGFLGARVSKEFPFQNLKMSDPAAWKRRDREELDWLSPGRRGVPDEELLLGYDVWRDV